MHSSASAAARSSYHSQRNFESVKQSLRPTADDAKSSGLNPEPRFIFINICELIKLRQVQQNFNTRAEILQNLPFPQETEKAIGQSLVLGPERPLRIRQIPEETMRREEEEALRLRGS